MDLNGKKILLGVTGGIAAYKSCELLRLLQKNGRMPFSEIGEAVGISRVAVKKRVMKLEAEGVIRGYKAVLHREGEAKMYLHIITKDAIPEELLYYLNRTGYVTELYIMAGENRVQATAVAPDVSELKYLTKMLRKTFSGCIKKLECHAVKEVIRDDFGGVAYDPLRFDGSRESNNRNE